MKFAARFLRLFSLATLTLLFNLSAYGQLGQGVITGTATDPSGAVVPNVTVLLTNSSTGVQRSATTNSDGVYRFDYADVGSYSLKTTAAGFNDLVINNVILTLGQTVNMDLALKPAAVVLSE